MTEVNVSDLTMPYAIIGDNVFLVSETGENTENRVVFAKYDKKTDKVDMSVKLYYEDYLMVEAGLSRVRAIRLVLAVQHLLFSMSVLRDTLEKTSMADIAEKVAITARLNGEI